MSNILVAKNYKISDHSKWWDDKSDKVDQLENDYARMEEILTESARKHIKDLDEVKVFRGEADNIRDVFKTNFYEIYDLWKQGHNILYADLDVLFIKGVDYFWDTKYFKMFNFTQPVSTTDEHYDIKFEKYFNCGLRYYPKDMSQDVWDLGISMVENWNPDRWDSEQIIYNAMLWSQDIKFEDHYDPRLAYQFLFFDESDHVRLSDCMSMNKQFNQIDLSYAGAVHVHGSRESDSRLRLMEMLSKGEFVYQQDEVLYL
jgi:hypothetical protein